MCRVFLCTVTSLYPTKNYFAFYLVVSKQPLYLLSLNEMNMTQKDLNGHILIKGTDLTPAQVAMLPFKGVTNNSAIGKKNFLACNSFYFKDGKPATEDSGFFYPLCTSYTNLLY